MINEKLCNQDTGSGEIRQNDGEGYREAKCLKRCGSLQGHVPRNLSGTKEQPSLQGRMSKTRCPEVGQRQSEHECFFPMDLPGASDLLGQGTHFSISYLFTVQSFPGSSTQCFSLFSIDKVLRTIACLAITSCQSLGEKEKKSHCRSLHRRRIQLYQQFSLLPSPQFK